MDFSASPVLGSGMMNMVCICGATFQFSLIN